MIAPMLTHRNSSIVRPVRRLTCAWTLEFEFADRARRLGLYKAQTCASALALRTRAAELEQAGGEENQAEIIAELRHAAAKLARCAESFSFRHIQNGDEHEFRVRHKAACRQRVCMIDAKKDADRRRRELRAVMAKVMVMVPGCRLIMATFTKPATELGGLSDAIDFFDQAFRRMVHTAAWKRQVLGWYAVNELTANAERRSWHLHRHTAIIMPPGYSPMNQDLWWSQDRWVAMWQKATRSPTPLVVDVRFLSGSGRDEDAIEAHRSMAELSKYITKPSSLFYRDPIGWAADPEMLADLHLGLRRRRMVSDGGIVRRARKALRSPEPSSPQPEVPHGA